MKEFSFFLFSILLVGCTQGAEYSKVDVIKDNNTSSEVHFVAPKEHYLLVEWKSDAMDRGNHDYDTDYHSELVVEPNYNPLERGDIIYYQMIESEVKNNPAIPENYLGRIVGLPGETVVIQNGQVYIDNQALDTFYGYSTIRGMDEDTYFEKLSASNTVDEQSTRDYFKTNMESIVVKNGTVFVLVDQWWRGIDSKHFGLLPLENVQGKVLGYSR
ncbi:signal peptidase I [Bacillus sp. REN16]|uniref:signal peptidase I n=1 Tax=Bacillus sp. REN16 TaxID=2887296 RepID=UPI001E4CC6EF|nr:signal peptidase I [Bacillus sp. REN16]MCC3359398.1 signal peptidase I [Bacillus sp. REN16]